MSHIWDYAFSMSLRKAKQSGKGHWNLRHGMNGTPTHNSWRRMIYRCRHKSHIAYRYYGGRGIRVCERWSKFVNFLEDMGPRPEGTTLDRIDSNGDYEPGNVRWATPPDQAKNRRSTRWITFNGKRQSVADWAKDLGLKQGTLHNRIFRLGWNVRRALTEPKGKWERRT